MRLVRNILLMAACLCGSAAWATHNRAGEIVYCQVSGLTYTVQIITHTKLSSIAADRPELTIDWGDGSPPQVLQRDIGVAIPDLDDVKYNVYPGQHTYPGPGTYTLSFEDPNRNEGVLNIPNSVNVPFCVKSQLVISPSGGSNCSVRFLNPPIQNACLQKLWVHNPGAYDPDGDSLSFELIPCGGLSCLPIPNYSYPNQIGPGANNQFSINPVTGTITWNSAQVVGEYNIAIRVWEWRKVNGVWIKMGYVVRDMQITVLPCSNEPPTIQQLADTCVVAGTTLTLTVQATDPDAGQTVALTAFGEPFVVNSSPATFTTPSPAHTITGTFNWSTNCTHVRPQPYQAVFRAADNDPQFGLENYSTLFISIIAPPPLDPSATPSGSTMLLDWDPPACTNVLEYRVYRRSGLYGFVPGHCETDVPAYTGYQFIGTTPGALTTYVDNSPLVFGNEYCYMVVAAYANGSRSIASEEFCAILNRQVPLITHVSVGETDITTGIDTVRWTNAYDLDTAEYPGPYQFKLYRSNGFTSATTLVHTSSLHPFLAHPDTSFLDTGIDTETGPHTYRLEFRSNNGDSLVGYSSVASSVFLTFEPDDEQLLLHFEHNTPWVNSLYEVYKWDGSVYNLLGTSTTDSYLDTGLVNGQEYCYYVKSIGAYSLPEVTSPLINFSQETCGIPVDLTPPCPPTLDLDNECEIPLNTLMWTNPNNSCADDTWQYHIWFAPGPDGPFQLIMTITGAEDTTFSHSEGSSVAGCYAVTAIDTVGNESDFSNILCGDNCPIYTLPNVFTPNSDGHNDLFIPFPYRGVDKVDLRVFNRWGQLLFETEDPDIDWDGKRQDSGADVPEGVYFYTCTVFFERLAGEEIIQLKGYVHLLRGSHNVTN